MPINKLFPGADGGQPNRTEAHGCLDLWAAVISNAVTDLRKPRTVLMQGHKRDRAAGERLREEVFDFFDPRTGGAAMICDACGFPFADIVRGLVNEGLLPKRFLEEI